MPFRDKQHKSAYDRERYARLKPEWLQRTNARHNAVRQAIRDVVIAYLADHPCVDCGEADPVVLDFDHVRGRKSFSISAANNRLCSVEKLRAEIAKCEIRCANCHRRKTHRERGHRCKRPKGPQEDTVGPRSNLLCPRLSLGHRAYLDAPRLISTRAHRPPVARGHRAFIGKQEWR